MSAGTIRILVAEDHTLVRDALVGLLDKHPGFQVVGAVPSIRKGMPIIERENPDLILADLCLEDGSAVQLARALRRPRRKTRVLFITGFNDCLSMIDLEDSGAAGLFLKEQSTEELFRAIEIVMCGGKYVPPTLLPARDEAGDLEPDPATRLSRREREVFRLITAGFQSKEIARRLFVSVKTVDTHRANMNQKLGVHTTADLVRFAHAHGIIVGPRRSLALETPRAIC